VVSTASGEEALTSLEASGKSPALLVTALSLSGLDGEELADHLQEVHPGLGVIYLAGHSVEGDRLMGVAGGRQLLTSPFSVESLTEAVRRALDDA
jgi:CheY-like chemotaxis protein